MKDQERQADQQDQSRGHPTSRWYLWGVVLVAALAFLIVGVCGYLFGWKWTGLPKRTLWDWLDLLIVPVVLVLGGYLFTRSENRRTQDIADQQRTLDRQIADDRRQDDTLQAYLDGMAQLLTDKDRPLHRAQLGDSLSTVARARTLTVLARLEGERKGNVVRFVHESGLITKDRLILDLRESDLSGTDLSKSFLIRADLRKAFLIRADLSEADLNGANLSEADLSGANLSGVDLLRLGGLMETWFRKSTRGRLCAENKTAVPAGISS